MEPKVQSHPFSAKPSHLSGLVCSQVSVFSVAHRSCTRSPTSDLTCHPPSCEEHHTSPRAPLLPQLLAPVSFPSGAVPNPSWMLHTHLFMPLPLSTSIPVLTTAWPIPSFTDFPLLDGNCLPTAARPTRVGLAPVLFSAVSLVLRAWCTEALQQTCLCELMNNLAHACWYRTPGAGARLTEESCSPPARWSMSPAAQQADEHSKEGGSAPTQA